jgi:outer membrane murein-binding lipoprotein Lpp
LDANVDRLGTDLDRVSADVDRLDANVDRLGADLDRLGTDLRGEIRSTEAETRSYVDERIQVSTASLLEEMGEFESRTRRHFDVVAESLRSDIRAVAEGMAASHEQTDRQLGEQTGRTNGLEGRVLRLEVDVSGLKADRKPRRPRRR